MSEMVSEMQKPHHSVLLGLTKIRLAQFRSAYVTKIDFYACMALSGERFTIKGNIGLERLRNMNTGFLTLQYHVQMYHGVFIPDDSYMTSDTLAPEWMDSLRVSFYKQTRASAIRNEHLGEEDGEIGEDGDNGEMDEELEEMIDRANQDQQQTQLRKQVALASPSAPRDRNHCDGHGAVEAEEPSEENVANTDTHAHPIAELKHRLLPITKMPSRFNSQISILLKKAVLSPRSAFADVALTSGRSDKASLQSQSPLSLRNKRSAVERNITSTTSTQVHFTCTHKFFVAGSTSVMQAFSKNNPRISLYLRNDVGRSPLIAAGA